MIYLDNASTTRVEQGISEIIYKSLQEDFANPSSLYKLGVESKGIIEAARQNIANSIHAKQNEIYFTACASESNNIAIYGLCLARQGWGKKIVATGYEHPSVRMPLKLLEDMGFIVSFINPCENGVVDIKKIVDAVDKSTILVTAIHVNNETGALIDIQNMTKAVKEKNRRTAVHIDITQSFMKIDIDASIINADSMAFSGHKVNAPKGIGGLYLRAGTNIKPIMAGGGQEKGIRAGTENIAYIKAINQACILHYPNIKENLKRYNVLKELLLERLTQLDNIIINSPCNGVPYIINFSFLGYKSETVLHFLEGHGIMVSSGSACSKGQQSFTLSQMGIKKERIESSLRVSFGIYNTQDDIEKLIEMLIKAKQEIQRIK